MASKKLGSVRELPSGRFQARYNYRYVTCQSTFPTKGEAYAWLEGEAKLIAFNEWTPPKERAAKKKEREQQQALTVAAWLKRWKDTKDWKITTRETNERALNNRILKPLNAAANHPVNRLKGMPINEVTVRDVYQWWDCVQSLYDTKTQNNLAYKLLKSAFKAALRRGLIHANPVDIPTEDRPKSQPDHSLPEDWELKAILDNMPAHYHCATVLCLYHGLRIGEALALSVDDVVERDGGLVVQVRKNFGRVKIDDHVTAVLQSPKTPASIRDVPIMPEFEDVVRKQLEARKGALPTILPVKEGDKSERTVERVLLTVTSRGSRVLDTNLRATFDRAKKKGNVTRKITPHSGRRWLTTLLGEGGSTPPEIGKIHGQKDLKVITETYMQARPGRTFDVMRNASDSVAASNRELERKEKAEKKKAPAEKFTS